MSRNYEKEKIVEDFVSKALKVESLLKHDSRHKAILSKLQNFRLMIVPEPDSSIKPQDYAVLVAKKLDNESNIKAAISFIYCVRTISDFKAISLVPDDDSDLKEIIDLENTIVSKIDSVLSDSIKKFNNVEGYKRELKARIAEFDQGYRVGYNWNFYSSEMIGKISLVTDLYDIISSGKDISVNDVERFDSLSDSDLKAIKFALGDDSKVLTTVYETLAKYHKDEKRKVEISEVEQLIERLNSVFQEDVVVETLLEDEKEGSSNVRGRIG